MSDKAWICIHCCAPANKRTLPDGRERPVCERCMPLSAAPLAVQPPPVHVPTVPTPVASVFMSKMARWPGGYDVDIWSNVSIFVDKQGVRTTVTQHIDVLQDLARRGYVQVMRPDYTKPIPAWKP